MRYNSARNYLYLYLPFTLTQIEGVIGGSELIESRKAEALSSRLVSSVSVQSDGPTRRTCAIIFAQVRPWHDLLP